MSTTESNWETFCDLFLSNEDKARKLIEKYLEMALQYKLDHKWQLAADNYYNAFEKLIEINKNNEALKNLMLSAECYDNCDMISKAIDSYKICSELYIKTGDIKKTADIIAKIGKLYETYDKHKAVEFYYKAVNYYKSCNELYGQKTYLEKINQIYLDDENFEDAIKIMKELIILILKQDDKYNIMRKYMTTEIYFNILLCYLMIDIVAYKKGMQQYYECNDFYKTMEYKFLEELGDTYEKYDLDEFSKIVSEYKSIKTFKSWQNKCFIKLYQNISNDEHNDLT